MHGELAALGIKIAASTVWNILHEHGIDPAPDRDRTTWTAFLHFQAQAIVSVDFFETRSLSGARLTVLAAIEHTPPGAFASSAQPPTPPRNGSPKSDAIPPWTSRTLACA